MSKPALPEQDAFGRLNVQVYIFIITKSYIFLLYVTPDKIVFVNSIRDSRAFE